ncbi:MAG: acetyl-CoA carboxylase biotin carboxyl carrier protein subunit [Anaerolineales bacterium]|nr:acetyl-CoA carboxylase biotin carboxyl carrier protein subunit [Chloroflexota bacterium]MBL6981974.1 acetyl-CoA carboxylase biotin carboxyl carrier protein subunit [Anaerolineales bacterium]
MSDKSQRVLVKIEDQEFVVEIEDLSATPVIAVVDGQSYEVVLASQVEKPQVRAVKRVESPKARTVAVKPDSAPSISLGEDVVTSPMPGDIVAVHVQPGQTVGAGDELCVLDAMKMKNVIYASREGVIASVEISVGQAVDYGEALVTYK